ncbi:hypothetical protein L7F22_064014 [Adiantum nelumboides]|nr:hypothetical protein [Adiantum nelumboides]
MGMEYECNDGAGWKQQLEGYASFIEALKVAGGHDESTALSPLSCAIAPPLAFHYCSGARPGRPMEALSLAASGGPNC